MPPLNPTQELRATLGGPQRLGAVLGAPQQLGTMLPSGPRGYSVDYAGIVERDGTMHGPNGWTIAHPSVGVYTITHNLNLDPLAYVVTGTPARGTLDPIDPGKASSIVTFVRDQQANYFVIAVVEGSPSGMVFVDAGFNFTLSPEMLAGDLIPGPPGPAGSPGSPGAPGPPGPEGIPLVVNGAVIGDASSGGSPPLTIQDEGSALAVQPALNFTGAGVSVSADAANGRNNVVIAGGGGLFTFTTPVNSEFTDLNSPTVTVSSLGISVSAPVEGASIRGRVKSAPATPYTIEAAWLHTMVLNNNASTGLLFRESSSGKIVHYCFGFAAANYWVLTFNTETSWAGSYFNCPATARDLIWMQISDNGSQRIFRISGDGLNWTQIHSHTRTDFLTANQVGFGVDCWGGGFPLSMTLVHWRQIAS